MCRGIHGQRLQFRRYGKLIINNSSDTLLHCVILSALCAITERSKRLSVSFIQTTTHIIYIYSVSAFNILSIFQYTSSRCFAVVLDACLSNPCQNGGTCTTFVDVYECECLYSYGGTNCELDGKVIINLLHVRCSILVIETKIPSCKPRQALVSIRTHLISSIMHIMYVCVQEPSTLI